MWDPDLVPLSAAEDGCYLFHLMHATHLHHIHTVLSKPHASAIMDASIIQLLMLQPLDRCHTRSAASDRAGCAQVYARSPLHDTVTRQSRGCYCTTMNTTSDIHCIIHLSHERHYLAINRAMRESNMSAEDEYALTAYRSLDLHRLTFQAEINRLWQGRAASLGLFSCTIRK